MLSKVGIATRAFVVVLLALAKRYEILLTVNRDSSTEQPVKASRRQPGPAAIRRPSPKPPTHQIVVCRCCSREVAYSKSVWGHDAKFSLRRDNSSIRIEAIPTSPFPPLDS